MISEISLTKAVLALEYMKEELMANKTEEVKEEIRGLLNPAIKEIEDYLLARREADEPHVRRRVLEALAAAAKDPLS